MENIKPLHFNKFSEGELTILRTKNYDHTAEIATRQSQQVGHQTNFKLKS